jgi:hypothetical protein
MGQRSVADHPDKARCASLRQEIVHRDRPAREEAPTHKRKTALNRCYGRAL